MSEVIIIGLDIAKHVFHVHGADERGRAIFSKRISRGKLLDFFAAHPSCTVAPEACGGAHHWARQLTQLGHEVRLIPPAYVKPFVKRQKNDAIDAEAICEAAQRPSRRPSLYMLAARIREQRSTQKLLAQRPGRVYLATLAAKRGYFLTWCRRLATANRFKIDREF